MPAPALVININYSFNTLVPGILGAARVNTTLVGILSYSAMSALMNIEAKQRVIFPQLPVGTSPITKGYTYLSFISASGIPDYLALEWIDQNTMVSSTTKTTTITIPNTTIQDVSIIRNALIKLGYININVA